MLAVQDLAKIKTQGHFQRASAKRIRVSDELELVTAAQEEGQQVDRIPVFLARLYTLLIAYAKAGITARPDAAQTETRADNSTRLVEVPLDVVLHYYHKVQERAARGAPLQWLIQTVLREREMWVSKFRNSTCSLGEAIQLPMAQREAMWEPPSRPQQVQSAPRPKGAGKSAKPMAKPPSESKGKGKRNDKGKKRAAPCRDFNRGSCDHGTACKWPHFCSNMLSDGKECRGSHPASRCTRT
jgi:hypothetical protein